MIHKMVKEIFYKGRRIYIERDFDKGPSDFYRKHIKGKGNFLSCLSEKDFLEAVASDDYGLIFDFYKGDINGKVQCYSSSQEKTILKCLNTIDEEELRK
ncbi:MAG: hypothetical protein ACOC3Z_03200 [Nanoarchaeota archaeon]